MKKTKKQPGGCEKFYTPWEGVDWQANGTESDQVPPRLAPFLAGSRYRLWGAVLAAFLIFLLILWLIFTSADVANGSSRFI
jgi:hypothetical protein